MVVGAEVKFAIALLAAGSAAALFAALAQWRSLPGGNRPSSAITGSAHHVERDIQDRVHIDENGPGGEGSRRSGGSGLDRLVTGFAVLGILLVTAVGIVVAYFAGFTCSGSVFESGCDRQQGLSNLAIGVIGVAGTALAVVVVVRRHFH